MSTKERKNNIIKSYLPASTQLNPKEKSSEYPAGMDQNVSTIRIDKKIPVVITPVIAAVNQNYFILNFLFGIILSSIAFTAFYYLKRNEIFTDGRQVTLFAYYIIAVIGSGIISNKFFLTRKHELSQIYRKLLISLIVFLGLLSFMVIVQSVENTSRMIFAGSALTVIAAEMIYFTLLSENKKFSNTGHGKFNISYFYFGCDLIMLTAVLYPILSHNTGNIGLNERFTAAAGLILLGWLLAGATTHKFNPLKSAANLFEATGLQIKFYLLFFSATAMIVFFLNIHPAIQQYFIKSILIYSGLSFGVFTIIYSNKIKSLTGDITGNLFRAYEMKGPATSPKTSTIRQRYALKKDDIHESVTRSKLQTGFLQKYPEVFNFIDRKVDLKTIDIQKTLTIRSADKFNIDSLNNNENELIINIHKMNDFRKINSYLNAVNKKLVKGGVYIGCFERVAQRYKNITNRYKTGFGNIIYIFDFIWRRVFPKLPGLRLIYFTLTRGGNRAISLSEGLGRLVYSGFEILDIAELDGMVYYTVRKARESTVEKSPSYSLIFKMRRIGLNGKPIFVYKLRTMHPYSEFLQNFIYTNNNLAEGGKFNDDFRITSWGKILRKFWIDELPMIYNWLKGDLKLVGVRPISQQYLTLYSKDFAEKRKMFKPGLFPPYYADLPKTIQAIEESERRYIEAYYVAPFETDLKYFFKIFVNIILRKKRSA